MSSNNQNDNQAASPVPPDHTKNIIYSIRRLVQGAELYTKELNKKYSVSSAQLNCLLALSENGPLPPSQIAKHILVKSSTVTGVVDRLEQKFNWKILPEWIVFTSGVIPALSTAIRSLTHPGDEIILQEPVYYPFFPVVRSSGCQIVTNELTLVNGRYEIDFADL